MLSFELSLKSPIQETNINIERDIHNNLAESNNLSQQQQNIFKN
jgi:hypothetical protein